MKKLYIILFVFVTILGKAQTKEFTFITHKYHSEVENWVVDDNRKIGWELQEEKTKFLGRIITTHRLQIANFAETKIESDFKVKKIDSIQNGLILHVNNKGVKTKFIVKFVDNKPVTVEKQYTNNKNKNTYIFKYRI